MEQNAYIYIFLRKSIYLLDNRAKLEPCKINDLRFRPHPANFPNLKKNTNLASGTNGTDYFIHATMKAYYLIR